jgi:hypothetical protein
MEPNTGTIFKVYLLDKTEAGLESGYVQLWKHKRVIQGGRAIPFDHMDEIPRKIRGQLKNSGIVWPKKPKKPAVREN